MGSGTVFLGGFRGNMALLKPSSWTLASEIKRQEIPDTLSHPLCDTLLQQLKVFPVQETTGVLTFSSF